MNLWDRYLSTTYELVDILKESTESSVALVYDRSAKQVCVMKQRALRSRELYQALKACSNPYIPRIYHLMEQDERLIIIEEYIDGTTLETYLEGRPSQALTEAEAADILGQLCECLAPLHQAGIIHRDIKPANIMLTATHAVKLIDFGIARIANPERNSDTEMLGTRGYAAPEQYGFGQTDARSDIYALGVTMSQMLGHGYHGYLEAPLARCRSLDPAQRYPSTSALLQDISRCQRHQRIKRWGLLAAASFLLGLTLFLFVPPAPKQEESTPAVDIIPSTEPPTRPSPAPIPSPEKAPEPESTPPSKLPPAETPATTPEEVPSPSAEAREERPSPDKKPEPPTEDVKHPDEADDDPSVESDVFIRESEWQREFHINEVTWRHWQQTDGSIYLPPEWTLRVHVDNPTRMDYPSARCQLRIIRPYAEPDEIVREFENGPVRAGETKDFVYPLSIYPLARITFVEITFRLKRSDGEIQPVAYGLHTAIHLESVKRQPAPNRKR